MNIRQSMKDAKKIAKRTLAISPVLIGLGLTSCGERDYATADEAIKHARFARPLIAVDPVNLPPNQHVIGHIDNGTTTSQVFVENNNHTTAATSPVPNATGVAVQIGSQILGLGASVGGSYAIAGAQATKIVTTTTQNITGKDATINGSQTTFKGGLTESTCYSLADGGSSAQCGTTGSNAITPNFTGSSLGTANLGSGFNLH